MGRIPFIAGNWKMNKTVGEAVSAARELRELVKDVKDREILVCPPFTALEAVKGALVLSNIKLGAQNLFYEPKGAFTGEISPLMLKEMCEYVILGHSERRQYFNETNETVNKKVHSALKHGLKPILCIGETLDKRKEDKTIAVVESQLRNSLKDVKKDNILNVAIAYEPVWAIGTGVNATPEQAEEVHVFIRELIKKMYDKKISEKIRILYGGSVTPENIKGLMEKENIDGALVGGSSLDPKKFAAIVNF